MSLQSCERPVAVGIAALSLCLLSGTAAARPAADTSFKKPRAEIFAVVKRIGLLPVLVAREVPDRERVAERYEAAVIARLEAAGLSVVRPAAMREIRERLAKTLGGLYDPFSGRPLVDKLKAYRDYANNEYLASTGVDATLATAIIAHRVLINGGSVSWDGIKDSATGYGKMTSVLVGMFATEVSAGTLPVLSLAVTLRDRRGELLYDRRAGLQPLAYVPTEGFRSKLISVDRRAVLTDPARDARALAIALDPLTRADAGQPTAALEAAPQPSPAEPPPAPIALPEFVSRYRTVAVAPLDLGEVEQRAEVQDQYRELLADRLAHLGFKVVGEADYGTLWKAEVAASGGCYDPFTGELDRGKLTAARKRAFALLRARQPVDAVVIPTIEMHAAAFRDGWARWDGAAEGVSAHTTLRGSIFDPSSGYRGEIPALSLVVRISGSDDEELYEEAGGVQLAKHFDRGHLDDVPEVELFAERSNNVRAVELALRALTPPKPR